jgi:NAD(P)-dependent dehydrogenase (short-subunit alcohol dehydrogenase family)
MEMDPDLNRAETSAGVEHKGSDSGHAFKLRCSKVLVTGGGSGIGLAIAKALLDNNCNVCICGRGLEKLEKKKSEISNERLSIMQWDVRDVSLVKEKLNEAAALLGGYLDGVVNNAGIYAPTGGWAPWNETSETWDAVMETNLKAPVFIMRAAATYMNNNHIRGNILNISSMAAQSEIRSAYSASKYTLSRMTRSMAKQVAKLGIVINAIAPGETISEITEANANHKPGDPLKSHAIGRVIEPEEIANIALFLMSEWAQIAIGDTILADGGYVYGQ